MFYPFGDERLLCQETLAEPDLAVVVNTSRLLEHLSGPGGLPHLRESAIALEPDMVRRHVRIGDIDAKRIAHAAHRADAGRAAADLDRDGAVEHLTYRHC